jgi:hypothetical protein
MREERDLMDKEVAATSELRIIVALDGALRSPEIQEMLEKLSREIEMELQREKEKVIVWRSVPLSIFPDEFPVQIRSSWVFGIQAKRETGAERHPRSHQRMMSYRGTGDMQVWDGKRWISRQLVSDSNEKMGKRWISIPPNTWHQVVTGENVWIVVSFHTVAEKELVEERPDANDPLITKERTYLP